MKIINIDSLNKPDSNKIDEISEYIIDNKVLLLPTNTVYGLHCSINSKKAMDKIYEIKKRDKKKPLILLIYKISQLQDLVEDISISAENIIERFWNIPEPEPLTIIFNRKKDLPDYISCGKRKLAVRIAGNLFLREIIKASSPVFSTSANISEKAADLSTFSGLDEDIKNNVDLAVNFQFRLHGLESTIIDLTSHKPLLVREGSLKYTLINRL